ncbi:MAG: aldehyde oxidase [Anaerolineales bacterium]|nr:MAG: aldehyde oxidase [Anaerolineales bacterium]
MLHAKILFAGRPHARIIAIDTGQAEALPGVVAVLTAKDVPVNEYGLQTPDQPVLCGPGSTKPGADVVRFVGDQVAVVVAESERLAARARDLVQIDCEDLPVVTDPFEALKPKAPQLHPDREPNPVHPELSTEGNRICHYQIRKGSMRAGWAAAEVVVEGEYHTPTQEHAYLQPEAGLAYIDDEGRIAVVAAGQWMWEDQRQIAHALDVSPGQVRVIYPAIGGAFGGREDPSLQIVLALAASKLSRPVKMVWSREESILGHCKRHPMWFRCKLGATAEGQLVAAEVRVVADGGAYCYTTNKVLGNTAVTCIGPYEIPNVKIDVDGVYTNNPPSGALRGFGSPQAHFAAEMQMNKLPAALDVDPVGLRMHNLLTEDSTIATGTPLPGGVSLTEVTEVCATAAGWTFGGHGWARIEMTKPTLLHHLRRGVGLAVAFKNVGFSFGYKDSCWARVELTGEPEEEKIESATVFIGSADAGHGSHTVIGQMAAEALSLPFDSVRVVASDTATSPASSGSASASRTTFMAGNAVRGAAAEALERWQAGDRPAAAEFTYQAPETTPLHPKTGKAKPNFSYGYVAQAVEVEVDSRTGELRLLRVINVSDVGKAINPQQVEGQIEGGVVQGVGWATCENLLIKDGEVLTPHLSTYLIPTISDTPGRLESLIVEQPDPQGPWGARGMGEMPIIPLAPALAAAVHDATGVWFDTFPLTAERIFQGIQARRNTKETPA